MANEQTIANLIVRLSAQTVELATGLKRAEGLVSGFGSAVQKIIGGISIAAIGFKLTKATLDAKNYAAEISKTAERIGVSTVDLSKLADVAQDVGLPLADLARGIRFLERSMLEASQTEGEHRAIFQALKVEFEAAPGVLRPAIDVLLDLADAFKRMGDEDPAKAPLAMRLMGRGAAEMIPLLNKGKATLTEWMEVSEKTGMVISEGLGRRAREFTRTLRNVEDAVKGVSLTFMAELLPSLQAGARWLLAAAEPMNSMRGRAGVVVEGAKILLASILPLTAAIIIHARWIGIANLALRAFGATMAFFSGPLGWVTIGVLALAVAWRTLGKEQRDAQRDQEKFVDSVRTMKMDELQMELRDTTRLLSMMKERYAALRSEMEIGLGELTLFDPAEADAMAKAIERYEERVKLLNKAISELNAQTAAPKIADPTVVSALQGKIDQLKASMAEFRDPVAKARAELEAFILQTVRGKGDISLYKEKIDELRKASERYLAASLDLRVRQARISGDLQKEVAMWDRALSDLEIEYDQGLVAVDSYYEERARIIEEKTNAEIEALQKRRDLPGVGLEQKIAIDLEIDAKMTGLEAALDKEKAAAKKAIDEFQSVVRESELQAFIDRNSAELEVLAGQYELGLVSMEEFFRKRREAIQAEAEKEIATIQAEIDVGLPDKERLEKENEIARIRARAGLDEIRLNKEIATERRKSFFDMLDLAKMLATVRAEGAADEIAAMRFQHQAELVELDRKNLEERNSLAIHLGQVSEIDMSFEEKRQAMKDLFVAQEARRNNTIAAQERAVQLKRLEMGEQVAIGLGELFSTLYEVSGKKIKAFFYLEKAAAIANAMINTAQGVTKALAQGGIYGPAMAGIIMATGAAQVALITAQTIKGFVKGGPVTKGSGRSDDVPAMLTRGEYVQPEPVVRYYGVQVMEAIRRKLVPREILQGFGFFPVSRPAFAFAEGGVASDRTTTSISVGPIHVDNPRLASALRSGIEDTIVRIMRDHHR